MAEHELITLPLDRIIVGPRLRAVDPDSVQLLAASMAESGQHMPIQVGPANAEGLHPLIAGAHRVAAAPLAGLASLRAIVFTGSQVQAELLEVDENLMRRELTELDRAVFLDKRRALYETLFPRTKNGGDRKTDQMDKNVHLIPSQDSFALETAKKLGFSRRHIDRCMVRARIEPELRELLAPTRWADHGATLDGLAKASPASRRRMVIALTRAVNPAPSFAAARAEAEGVRENERSTYDVQLARLSEAWRKASERGVRGQFLRLMLTGAGNAAHRDQVRQILEEFEAEGGEARVLRAIGGRAA